MPVSPNARDDQLSGALPVNLSVCLETLFTELPVEERVAQIAACGYSAVEFWHPEATWDGKQINAALAKDASAIRQACREHGVTVCGFVLNAWDGVYGGCPVHDDAFAPFIEQVHKMIAFAEAIDCRALAVLSGTVDPGLSRPRMRANLEKALAAAAEIAGRHGCSLFLEPLNTLVDHAGYYLHSTAEAIEILDAVASPHLKLLYDIYHMQIMEGNVLATIERHIQRIGHFHSAAVPGRAELFAGELDYSNILRRIAALGYEATFGLEYFPQVADHQASLKRTRQYLQTQAAEH